MPKKITIVGGGFTPRVGGTISDYKTGKNRVQITAVTPTARGHEVTVKRVRRKLH